MGSFSSDGQRYSLMTVEAMKASRTPDRRPQTDMPLPVANMSLVNIGDTVHVVEPVRYSEDGILDDTRKALSLYSEPVDHALWAHTGCDSHTINLSISQTTET